MNIEIIFSIQRQCSSVTIQVHISHCLAYNYVVFNFILWFENNLHGLRMDSLSMGFRKLTSRQRMITFFTEQT